MLTKTTIVAIQALTLLALEDDGRPKTPKQLAARLGASPSYLGKILGMLAKGGILRSVRGAHGGVHLARKPSLITLLDVYAATQGALVPHHCTGGRAAAAICTFHTAMSQLHQQLEGALTRWSLADLASVPSGKGARNCRMASVSSIRRALPVVAAS